MVVVVVVNVNGIDQSINFKNDCDLDFAEGKLSKFGPGLLLGGDGVVVDTPNLPEGKYRYRLITQPMKGKLSSLLSLAMILTVHHTHISKFTRRHWDGSSYFCTIPSLFEFRLLFFF